jgi:hypothetical protein
MRKDFLILFVLFGGSVSAQDFSGYKTGNYTGVNGVFSNPASIADSRYRWDFTLFNFNTSIGNNKASFSLKDLGRTLDGDSIKNQIFSESGGASSALVSVVVQGPSLFFNLSKKSAIALTTRARVMTNVTDIDGKLAKQLLDDGANDIGFPYTISSTQNMAFNVNAWTEFGASYAREIFSKGRNYLKGGASIKYLAGAANAYLNIDRLNATINEDQMDDESYLTNASGKIGLGFGGINVSDFESNELLSFKSRGIGGDIGFVYEMRQKVGDEAERLGRDFNKYKLRIGVSILDIGSIKYHRDVSRSGSYTIHVNGSQRFYLSALADAGIDEFKDTLNKYPQFFTADASAGSEYYNVSLPSTLQLNVDYHLRRGLYLNLAAQFALTNSRKKPFNSQYYNSFTITPRFEGKRFGFYLPLSYSSLTQFTAGASLRLASFFIGSGSILSAAFGSSKQADIFIGLHFGSLQKNKERRNYSKADK